jgi:hypothetical protein
MRLMVHGPDGSPRDVGRAQRFVTPALRRLLDERDAGCCQFPGCPRRRNLHAHHVRHWFAHGGTTDLANLVLLCGFHHRLVHEHGYRVQRGDDRWTFVRPDGRPIPNAPPTAGDGRLADLPAAPEVTAHTAQSAWGGEEMSTDYVADLVLELRARQSAA